MTDCFLQHAVKAIAGEMLDEAASQQRLGLCEFTGAHDSVTPRPVHVHEVETFTCVSRRDLISVQHHRFPGSEPGDDSRGEPGPSFLISWSANALATNTPMPHATILCPAIGRSDSITFAINVWLSRSGAFQTCMSSCVS